MTEKPVGDDMQRLWHGAEIDISQWTFFDDENAWRDLLMAGFAVAVTKTLRTALAETPPTLSLPFAWGHDDGLGGKRVEDPATLHMGLALGEDTDEHVYWEISLEKCIDDLIWLNASGDIGKCEGDSRVICNTLAARLRELATKLDDACAEHDRPAEKESA